MNHTDEGIEGVSLDNRRERGAFHSMLVRLNPKISRIWLLVIFLCLCTRLGVWEE